jgi:hypothetical protein
MMERVHSTVSAVAEKRNSAWWTRYSREAAAFAVNAGDAMATQLVGLRRVRA